MISVRSYSQLDAGQFYQFFLNVLDVYGYTVVSGGTANNVLKVVPAAKGGRAALINQAARDGDDMVMQMVRMQNLSGAALAPILDKFNENLGVGSVRYYPPGNSLFITGRANEVNRIADIVKGVDAAGGDNTIEMLPVRHMKPAVMAKMLTAAYKNTGGSDVGTPLIVGDNAINMLLINGNPATRRQLRQLAMQMDNGNHEENSHVFFLKYAEASQLASVLSGNGDAGSDDQPGLASSGGNDTPARASTGSNAGNSINSASSLTENSTRTSPGYGSALGPTSGGGGMFSDVRIQADRANNALLVNASPDEMEEIAAIIQQLDVRRNQVLVEAIVVEVQNAEGLNLGVAWANAKHGGTSFSQLNTGDGFGENQPIVSALQNSQGLVAGFYRGNWGALFNALESNRQNNILATPSIVTLDNQQANFNVGQDVPILTGSQTTNSDNIFNTVERRTVGIKFSIRPRINQGETVHLDISQEISSLADATASVDPNLGSVFNIRTVSNAVQVEDGETVVIGGLLDNEQKNTESKVPLLGDIPWLGALFRYTSKDTTKRNLMLFIRPHVIRYPTRYDALTRQKSAAFQDDERAENPHLVNDLNDKLSTGASSDIGYIQRNIARFTAEISQ